MLLSSASRCVKSPVLPNLSDFAGKTTILGMLAGRIQPTSGDAVVDGQSIVSRAAHARAALGFCPQQDPLLDLLTGWEHLALYARLKVHSRVLQGAMRLGACARCIWLAWIMLPL